jgi:hypothetical protein
MRYEKVAPRLYVTHAEVSLPRYGCGAYTTRLALRLDGREGPYYRADMMCLSPWESIDGSRETAPRTLKEGKALIARYLEAVRAQGTLHPKMNQEQAA